MPSRSLGPNDRSGQTCHEESQVKSLLMHANGALQTEAPFEERFSYIMRDQFLPKELPKILMKLVAKLKFGTTREVELDEPNTRKPLR